MKFIWKHLGTSIWLIVTSILLVLAIVVSVLATSIPLFANSISLVFGGERANIVEDRRDELYDREFKNKKDVLAAAEDFVIDVEKEGAILLKNENDALPLAAENPSVSVFGKNSVNLVYSGSGSANSTSGSTRTLYESLEAAGINYNPQLKSFYEDNSRSGSGRPANPPMTSGQRLAGFGLGETPVSSYGSDLVSSYGDYDDAAIVVFSRIGGEGFDLPRTMATDFTYSTALDDADSPTSHYLELGKYEKQLLEYVKEHFSTVIVLLNTGSTMELGGLASDSGIDAVMWIGFPGSTGIMAVGQLLAGKSDDGEKLSPSGRTTDTWAADFTKDPTWYNTGIYGSEKGNRYLYDGSETAYAFVNYEEGIYAGYRYWETRGYEEEKADPESDWYAENVVYPFGYGLSYTTFDWDITFSKSGSDDLSADDTITATVTVTNTGDYAGKDVVQLYYTAPYYEGGIEKSQVVLADFAKTDTLYPADEANGESKPNSQQITLTLKARDMASYDYADANENGFKGYELDAGDYVISVRKDAHTAADSQTYNLKEGATLRTDTDARGNTVTVENRFDDVSAGISGDLTYEAYISRSDFAGTVPSDYITDAERTLTEEQKEALDLSIRRNYTQSDEGKPWQVTGAAPSTTPVDSGLSLADMLYDENGEYVGKVDYDDPRWETLLNEISLDEMKLLVGYAAFRTGAVAGINNVVNKPITNDSDGPSGFTSFVSDSVVYDTCAYQGECVMGATWNVSLAERMGELVGEEALVGNEKGDGMPYTGWYAPAVNLHRSPFGGRNWEYYSEDGLLSGKLAASVVSGASKKGVNCYLKHFAVNDQETDREYNGILVWANEQSMREIYLKPFEIAVKEGGATGMMSSFNRIGMTWAGGSYALLTEVLRNEWGFRGAVITDYSMNTYTQVDLMLRAGGDLFLTQATKTFAKEDDATQITLLRQATKNVLYTTANSNVMSIRVDGYKSPVWVVVMICVDVAIVAGLAAWGAAVIITTKRKESRS